MRSGKGGRERERERERRDYPAGMSVSGFLMKFDLDIGITR
jgi:hypothetical protein